ncbi:MAG: glutamyl-tRNA reductase [Desulfomonilaceae bacterium]|nr:glutamyl-tRNA reductase [Desulfomonilaceae bacterium]
MNAAVLVIGLNHVTAPVEIREKITFPGDHDGKVTRRIMNIEGVEEAMILSTCNRAEIIAMTDDAKAVAPRIVDSVGEIHGVEPGSIRDYLYIKEGGEAVRHVFRVSASLDSMVLGEPQILGQVKDGYRRAANVHATGPILNRLMHRAFFTAKRVRNETGVGIAAVSVAYVAVELAQKILGDLRDKSVLLIGAGEMAELAARHLVSHVERPLLVVNRTFETACTLAGQFRGSAAAMDRLEDSLAGADVVITSTGSCEALITTQQVKRVMRRRRYRPIFLIDIAIPRDIESGVHDIDGVYLYNIDDLQAVVEENMGERRQEALRAETIVAEEVEKFLNWTRTLDSAPTIIAFREKLEAIRAGELARINGKLAELTPEERDAVEMITRSIINKIAHDPISFLKKYGARSKGNTYLDITQKLFNLNGLTEEYEAKDQESPDT